MPYYPDKNILFIHIPKTAGTVIENEIKKHTKQKLYSGYGNTILETPFNKSSLQHQYYTTIYKYRKKLNVNFKNIKVFCCIRNPYNRIISDLFWLELINKNSSPEKVKKVILENYLYRDDVKIDGHNTPQYKYVTDENEKLLPNIKIFKCEELNKCNNELCKFLNLNINVVRPNVNKNYSKYLNKETISIINKFYKKDFEIFNFQKLK